MTKEEILLKTGVTYISKVDRGVMMIREYVPGDDVVDILKAMDEYAKQQAIAFAIAYATQKMDHPDRTPPSDDRIMERYDYFLKNGSALGV